MVDGGRDALSEIDEDLLYADGFDDAILGLCYRAANVVVVAYDRAKCIQILIDRDGMSHEEAEEFFEYNTVGAWVGDRTPVFIETFP